MDVKAFGTLLLGLNLFLTACAWQRIEPVPIYSPEASLPIVVGLQPPTREPGAETATAEIGGELQDIGLFSDIVYPYRAGDPIDCMLVVGARTTATGEGVGAGALTGLTFGLAGMAVGPSTNVRSDVKFHLTDGTQRIISGVVHVETEAEFGMFADIGEVARRQGEVQLRKIAIEIASNVNSNRDMVLAGCRGYIASSTYDNIYDCDAVAALLAALETQHDQGVLSDEEYMEKQRKVINECTRKTRERLSY